MMLEGGVVEDLSHMQNREPVASHISKSTLPQGKDDSRIYCPIDIQLIIDW